jgi:hypothetical protein
MEKMKIMGRSILRASNLLALSVLFLAAPANYLNAQPEKFNYKLDEKKLLSGGIQTFEQEYQTAGQGIKKRVVGVMILNAPPDKVWQVLLDWDSMGPYVDNLEYNKTIHVFTPVASKDQLGHSLIESRLKVLYLTIDYTLDVKFDNVNFRQDWDLVSDQQAAEYNKQKIPVKEAMGGLKDVEGFEYIEPYGDGSKTVYYYAPIVETAVPMPGFLQTALSKTTLNGYMEGIRKITAVRCQGKAK